MTHERARHARSIAAALSWLRQRLAYGLALLPILTDWIDTGHWPHHLRELASEVVIGCVILAGVHRLRTKAETFRVASETDPLTGLGNRLRFRRDIDRAVARASSDGAQLTLAFVDVDRFKQINDSQGHDAGDRALREVAQALARSVREGFDACYRLGGDEFAVLMTEVTEAQAIAALQRGFARASVAWRPLTCSVGAVALASSESADGMLRRADQLMYRAKLANCAAQPSEGLFGRVGGSTQRPQSVD